MATARVLYIAGTGRSGSTVLARCLESALDGVHVGELRYVWDRGVDDSQLCECGRPFSDCAFWSSVLHRAYPQGAHAARLRIADLTPHVDRLRHIPANSAVARGLRRSEHVRAYGDCLVPLYDAIAERSGSSVVIDSSKDPSYLFALRATGRIELQVLHLVRDSRAVAHSWTRRKRRPEIHWAEQMMRVLPPARSARTWLEHNAAIEAFGAVGPHPVRVRYEDFADDPEACVAGLARTLDLPLRPGPAPAERHSFSGNPMRFETAPVRVSRDDAWTRDISDQDRRTVSLITWPLLLKYGYPAW
jgi:hypothetical protein